MGRCRRFFIGSHAIECGIQVGLEKATAENDLPGNASLLPEQPDGQRCAADRQAGRSRPRRRKAASTVFI
jgi:hypothetical protein